MRMKIVLLFGLIPCVVHGQFSTDTTQYELTLKENTETLVGEIQSHPDVNLLFYPEREYISRDYYVYSYPESANYRLGVLIDPCRYNSYNCCMNVFGSPEYPSVLNSGLDQDRVFKYQVLASDTEVAKNYVLVDEDGGSIAASSQRSADDFALYNESCDALNSPDSSCQGRNYAFQRSPLRPPCMDNNSSLDVTTGCYNTNGTWLPQCIQVAYSSNTFIPQCGVNEDDHCGTYLEIHVAHGTPYNNESEVIADVLIDQRNVSGYYTTTIPVTWMGNSTPVCCCPPPFQADTRVGSFLCPIGPTDDGPYAYRPKSLADTLNMDTLLLDYPFCPIDISANVDRMMCSTRDVQNRREYTRNCSVVSKTSETIDRSWTSSDLTSLYDDSCPYYDSCATTLDGGKCRDPDRRLTFIGRVGIITALDNVAAIPQVWLTFNEGRTSYQFSQQDVVLETYKSMYEMWWVVRSKSWKTVQKRKGFNVTSPDCTFDSTNNRYFPYAILKDGQPLDNSQYP